MTLVSGSSASSRAPNSVIAPSSSLERSRPPVPMAWEMPSPQWAMVQLTSCMPVPEAPTMPMRPRGTRLANPSPTPAMIAVPQSGPITSRPSSRARFLKTISSSSGTLFEKRKTCLPASSARRVTNPA